MLSKLLSALTSTVCAAVLMVTCTASTQLPPAVPAAVFDSLPPDPPPVSLPYDFSQPVPQSEPVDAEYFSDAAFVGDSRTDGFCLFSGVGGGDNLTATGLSVFTLGTKQTIKTDEGTLTVLDALERKAYGKVYLSLGVNELGYHNNDAFYAAYCAAIDAVRTRQPNAVIYVQTLIPLNEARIKAVGGASYLTNQKLCVYNDIIRRVAREKQVPLLDLYSVFAVDGQLPEDFSRDGVHLTAAHYAMQLDYFKTHTVSLSQLNTTIQPVEELI